MALFFLPATLAEAPFSEARLTYTTAQITGNITSGEIFESLLFLPPDELKRADVTIRASNLVVNWTEVARYHIMDPRNPSDSLSNVQQGPAVQDETDHGTGSASAHFELSSSNLLLLGLDQGMPLAEFDSRTATIQANPHETWTGGSESRATASQPDPNGTYVQVPLPASASQTELQQSRIRITGNLTIHLWDTILNVTDRQGTTSYHAGMEFIPVGNPAAPVSESRLRLITVRALEAEIDITLEAGRALVVSPHSSIIATGEARLNSALGNIQGHPVLDEPITIRGEFRLDSTDASAEDTRLRGLLSYRTDVTDVRTEAAQIVAPSSATDPVSPWWFAAASIPILLVGTIAGIRRYGPVTLDDVEFAILSGHDRRAHRSARRLVHKTPRDPDAVFLYATTLLQRKDFQPLLEKIEPLAAKIPRPERRGIAFVLAVASHALGDKQRSAKWGAEAAHEPLLAQKLEESGVGSFKPGPSRFTQSGYA